MLKEMNLKSAASFLGIKESKFRKIMKDGEGPRTRPHGTTFRFLEAHLSDWADEYANKAFYKVSAKVSAKKTADLLT